MEDCNGTTLVLQFTPNGMHYLNLNSCANSKLMKHNQSPSIHPSKRI